MDPLIAAILDTAHKQELGDRHALALMHAAGKVVELQVMMDCPACSKRYPHRIVGTRLQASLENGRLKLECRHGCMPWEILEAAKAAA